MRLRVDNIDTKAGLENFEESRLLISYIGPHLTKGQKYLIRLDFSSASCADFCIRVLDTYGKGITYLSAEIL